MEHVGKWKANKQSNNQCSGSSLDASAPKRCSKSCHLRMLAMRTSFERYGAKRTEKAI